ncbi:hypothetical protein OHR68_06700 [Spirillospora sp. NBC_00431]
MYPEAAQRVAYVGNHTELPDVHGQNPPPGEPRRLIYFDQPRVADVLAQLAALPSGRDVLTFLGKENRDENGDVLPRGQRTAMFHFSGEVGDGEAVDLETMGRVRLVASELHPSQVIVVRGLVRAAEDVKPSSVKLRVGSKTISVLVDKGRHLHLNKSYLVRPAITVVGVVRSVPSRQVEAAAICACVRAAP